MRLRIGLCSLRIALARLPEALINGRLSCLDVPATRRDPRFIDYLSYFRTATELLKQRSVCLPSKPRPTFQHRSMGDNRVDVFFLLATDYVNLIMDMKEFSPGSCQTTTSHWNMGRIRLRAVNTALVCTVLTHTSHVTALWTCRNSKHAPSGHTPLCWEVFIIPV